MAGPGRTLLRKGRTFMDLPAEIRYAIYRYLFCHHGESPIWLSTKYCALQTFEPVEEEEPIFHTAIFRVCRAIHEDSVKFAYGVNNFVLRDSFPAFCRLGSSALAAIRHLTIMHTTWTSENEAEDRAWAVIQRQCTNLKRLEVELHADLLLQSIPHLTLFFHSLARDDQRRPPPGLTLDLYVWDKYFSFDPSDRDMYRARNLLLGIEEKCSHTPRFVDPQARVLRLPSAAEDIVLRADVSQSAVQALDNFLKCSWWIPLVKETRVLPITGRRAVGRSKRFCYVWCDPGLEV